MNGCFVAFEKAYWTVLKLFKENPLNIELYAEIWISQT